ADTANRPVVRTAAKIASFDLCLFAVGQVPKQSKLARTAVGQENGFAEGEDGVIVVGVGGGIYGICTAALGSCPDARRGERDENEKEGKNRNKNKRAFHLGCSGIERK